jgi:ATP-dependent DNA helicase DinG
MNVSDVLGAGGLVAQKLPGFEQRPEQLEMALGVARALEERHHLMVEAGTGVGKSFAYLVPVILAVAERGLQRVVISTHTISLQEQLLEKDLPFLRAAMPHEFSAALVKGRSNYVSLRRLRAAHERASAMLFGADEFAHLDEIARWAAHTSDGSLSDLPRRPMPQVWDEVRSESNNCLGRQCPDYEDCHFFAARRRIHQAQILIVNHSLFFSDLALRAEGASLLPAYDAVVFDEAHTLESVASEHLGLGITSAQVEYLLNKLFNPRTSRGLTVFHRLPEAERQVESARAAAAQFFDAIAAWQQGRTGPTTRVREPLAVDDVLSPELDGLARALKIAADGIPVEAQRLEVTAAQGRCLALADAVRTWMAQREQGQVHWVEIEQGRRRRVSLNAAPIDVGPLLGRELFAQVPSCILTSATLCVGREGAFDFFRERLGLEECRTLKLGSPFDYRSQAEVHLAPDMPDPAEGARFEAAAVEAIRHYLELTRGSAFVLFTSYRMMKNVAAELEPWLRAQGMPLFNQGDGTPAHPDAGRVPPTARRRPLRNRQLLARCGRARRGTPQRHHHQAALQRARPSPSRGAPRRHPRARRHPLPRLPAPRSHHQAEARLRPPHPHQDRHRSRRDPGSANCQQALRSLLLESLRCVLDICVRNRVRSFQIRRPRHLDRPQDRARMPPGENRP